MAKKDTAVYLNWGVIALAILLVWPVGVVLIALKFTGLLRQYRGVKLLPEGVVPFKDEKTTPQIKIYRSHMDKQKRKLNGALVTMVIGLLVGCVGITLTWINIGTGGIGIVQEKLSTTGLCILFALAGIMQGMSAYNLLAEKKKLARMAAIIGDRRIVTEAELSSSSGLPIEEVRTCLQTMFDRCYFANGVHANEEDGTFICHG